MEMDEVRVPTHEMHHPTERSGCRLTADIEMEMDEVRIPTHEMHHPTERGGCRPGN